MLVLLIYIIVIFGLRTVHDINKTQTQFVYCFYTLLKTRQKEITHMQQGSPTSCLS
jgi:hypothetical protein